MSDVTVHEVGEFGLIERLLEILPPETRASRDTVPIAAGDDAAVLRHRDGGMQIVTTDALVEGIHFRLDWTDWESLGHKSLAVNLSDIAAMGGTPATAFVTLGLRGDEGVTDLEDMYRGLGALAKRHEVVIAGGDIVRVPETRLISITVLGSPSGDEVLVRSGARPGDVIGITGTIGASAAGMEILRDPQRYARHTTTERLVRAHLRPEPRIRAGQVLVGHGASAAMDLSDGLAGDLPKLLVASDVSAEIRLDALPAIAAVRALFANRWQELAFRGGEDYELLFAISEDRWNALHEAASDEDITVTQIGAVVERGNEPALIVRHPDGAGEVISTGAYDHFR